jgi:hypothetical protein
MGHRYNVSIYFLFVCCAVLFGWRHCDGSIPVQRVLPDIYEYLSFLCFTTLSANRLYSSCGRTIDDWWIRNDLKESGRVLSRHYICRNIHTFINNFWLGTGHRAYSLKVNINNSVHLNSLFLSHELNSQWQITELARLRTVTRKTQGHNKQSKYYLNQFRYFYLNVSF